MRRIATQEQLFWEKVQKGNDCWEWTGHHCAKGYGRCWFEGKVRQAHRVSYQMIVGEIPAGMTLDHTCRNRGCVNPAHVEPVTNKVNVLRGNSMPAQNHRKTHCAYGHEFTDENTYIRVNGAGRECRECRREYQRRKVASSRNFAQ